VTPEGRLRVDLAGVISCDYRLFDVLAWTHQFLADYQGWMRLVGIGPAVVNALDEALPAEFLLVRQVGDWGAGVRRAATTALACLLATPGSPITCFLAG
jgi:hypothetical protein